MTSLSQGPNNPSAWSHKHKLEASIYLLQLLQTLRNVEGDVDERTVSLVLEHEHTPQTHTHTETSGSELRDCERSKLRHVEGLTATLRGMCVCVLPHLYFIVLEEHVGFEVVDGLVDDVGVTACRKQKHVKKREVTSNQSPVSSRNSKAAKLGGGGAPLSCRQKALVDENQATFYGVVKCGCEVWLCCAAAAAVSLCRLRKSS